MALISALLSKLLADEFKAWSPAIVQHLVRYAVSRLPKDHQARYEEEWASHVNEVPGEVGKLLTAVGFLFAARRMAATDSEWPPVGDIAKRIFDVIGSAILLVYVLPLLPLIALVIWLTSKSPVIVAEDRIGQAGRPFKVLTFGTAGPLGKFLESSRLAYLPLLLNIVRGDMAFVGPAADKPEESQLISRIIPTWMDRTSIRPGIVRFADSHIGETVGLEGPFHAELTSDLYYIKNRSLKLDMLILLRSSIRIVHRP
jgi:lipopolysaccharide/colanic/teichoic acid biosynthesis glycosyltransferase